MDLKSKTSIKKCPYCGGDIHKVTYNACEDNPMKFNVTMSCDDCDAFKKDESNNIVKEQ